MTSPATVTVTLPGQPDQTIELAAALQVASQIVVQAGPLVYARADMAQIAALLHRVQGEEARSEAIRRRGLRRIPAGAA